MRGGIVFAEIGFDFDDAAGREIVFFVRADEQLAQKVAGYAARGAGVEGARERKA